MNRRPVPQLPRKQLADRATHWNQAVHAGGPWRDGSGSSPDRGALPVNGDYRVVTDDPGNVAGWKSGDLAGNDLQLGAVLHGDMQAT